MMAFIESLKDDTCTPKPAKLNAWVYIIDLWFICVFSHPVVRAFQPAMADLQLGNIRICLRSFRERSSWQEIKVEGNWRKIGKFWQEQKLRNDSTWLNWAVSVERNCKRAPFVLTSCRWSVCCTLLFFPLAQWSLPWSTVPRNNAKVNHGDTMEASCSMSAYCKPFESLHTLNAKEHKAM